MCFSVEVNRELKRLQNQFSAGVDAAAEEHYEILKSKHPNLFKEPKEDNRIFPGYFAWVMVQENGRRVFKRMRYRVRPQGSKEEIPSKFNVFNARIDSLTTRQTWRPLFTRKHGIFPFTRFYEWVEDEGKKRLISFAPKEKEIMWAPCLWDHWISPDKELEFYSFAIITDDPPPEVLEKGTTAVRSFFSKKLSKTG